MKSSWAFVLVSCQYKPKAYHEAAAYTDLWYLSVSRRTHSTLMSRNQGPQPGQADLGLGRCTTAVR